MPKAEAVLFLKTYLHNNRYVQELVIFKVAKNKNFPEGIKYRLILIEVKSKKKVLFDNHRPKGHHYHLNNNQYSYQFSSIDKLVKDFKTHCYQHMGVKL